jgi:CheY-like chemotaxis protein
MDIEYSVATNYAAVLELARTKRPQVVIVDTELPGGSGYDLVQELKADDSLGDMRVMLVLHSAIPHSELEQITRSGCDDILCVPLRAGEFFSHIAQVLGLPFRRQERIAYPADASILVEDTRTEIHVEDIALGGVGVTCAAELVPKTGVELQLFADLAPIPANIAWVARTGDGWRAGIAFGEIPVDARMRIEQSCLFSVTTADDGQLIVSIHGRITEHSDLEPIRDRLKGVDRVEFNMRDIVYMSSVGVRTWCDFLRDLGDTVYTFFHASIAFASQVAMVPMVVGHGSVRSLEAPYYCEECDREDIRLLTSEAVLRKGDDMIPPPLHCGTCNTPLEFDDLPNRYFAHLLSPSSIDP